VTQPAPPLPFLPAERYGQPALGMVLVWAGDLAEGERAIAPLRRAGTPMADAVCPMPYLAVQSMLDAGAPHGGHYYWKAHRVPELNDDVVDAFGQRMGCLTTPLAQITAWAIGGAVSRTASEATAVAHREPGFEVSTIAAWPPSDPDGDRHRGWVREGWERLRPHSAGVYSNFLSDEGAAGVEAAYGPRLRRLTAVKDRYDPTNFFRMNANIPPSGGATR
jgi:hypothetical protein